MPITIGCLDKMGIDPRVTRFVIPVGTYLHKDLPLASLTLLINDFLT